MTEYSLNDFKFEGYKGAGLLVKEEGYHVFALKQPVMEGDKLVAKITGIGGKKELGD